MNRPCDEFLARARLTVHENVGIEAGNLFNETTHVCDGGRAAGQSLTALVAAVATGLLEQVREARATNGLFDGPHGRRIEHRQQGVHVTGVAQQQDGGVGRQLVASGIQAGPVGNNRRNAVWQGIRIHVDDGVIEKLDPVAEIGELA